MFWVVQSRVSWRIWPEFWFFPQPLRFTHCIFSRKHYIWEPLQFFLLYNSHNIWFICPVNGHFPVCTVDDVPIQKWWCSVANSVYQRVQPVFSSVFPMLKLTVRSPESQMTHFSSHSLSSDDFQVTQGSLRGKISGICWDHWGPISHRALGFCHPWKSSKASEIPRHGRVLREWKAVRWGVGFQPQSCHGLRGRR